MQTATSHHATDWSREGPRTLIAKDGAVWLWPGIPLAMEQDGTVQPLPRKWVRPWVTALHGFEAQPAGLETALARAAEHLTDGDEASAQTELDLAKIERLSPEGAALMHAVAAELGISSLEMVVGSKSLPWGTGYQAAHLALFRHFGGAASRFEKSDNPDQPRWPKGAPSSQGGRYAPTNGGDGSSGASVDEPPRRIGDNGGPPLEDIPDIPEEEPSPKLRNAIIRSVAVWALERGAIALIPGVGEAAAIIQLGVWLYQYLPLIDAYLQPPQTLQELQDAVSDPKEGYQIHHIVEQTPARKEGYSDGEIEAPENLVRISELRHRQISDWYSSQSAPESEFGGLSPRDYLRDKGWDEKVRVGREALVDFGVLKP